MASELTAERARELLVYDPETGELRWKVVRTGTARAGTVAGCRYSRGYILVRIDRHKHIAHHLAWLITHGDWPEDQIDHINGIRDDNRLINLRQASNMDNRRNMKRFSVNTSGHTGVHWHRRGAKWRAEIRVSGKHISLGLFSDLADAVAARNAAVIEYGYDPLHGQAQEVRAARKL